MQADNMQAEETGGAKKRSMSLVDMANNQHYIKTLENLQKEKVQHIEKYGEENPFLSNHSERYVPTLITSIDTGMQVKMTTDYDSIKSVPNGLNRQINPANLSAIIKSMSKEQLMVPSIINENSENIDGQHRLEACRYLGLPFYYIVVPGYSYEQIQRINAHQEKWSNEDVMVSRLASFNGGDTRYESYNNLGKMMDEFPGMNLSVAMKVSNLKIPSADIVLMFRSGEFEFEYNSKTKKFVEDYALFLSVMDESKMQTGLIKCFAKYYFYDDFDIERFLKNVHRYTSLFINSHTNKEYMDAIAEAHNYRLGDDEGILPELVRRSWNKSNDNPLADIWEDDSGEDHE